LDGKHIREIVEHGKMLNPPSAPPPPDLPAETEEEPPASSSTKVSDNELPGGLAGAAPAGA